MNDYIVEALVNEYDILQVQEGQPVVLTTETAPNKLWTGKISHVSLMPATVNDGNSIAQYPIKVKIDDKNDNLKPGFKMLVEIEVNKKAANTLPLTAIIHLDDNTYVYLVNDGIVESRQVTTGIVSGEYIEIIDGVNKHDKVIIDVPEDVEEGMEVSIDD